MSPRFTMLARPDHRELECQTLARQLAAHGIEAPLRPLPPVACLRFRLNRPGGTAICRVEATGWAGRHLPDLAGLDWQGMGATTIYGLTAQPLPLHFEHPALAYDQGEPLPPLEHAGTPALPMVRSKEGPVWLERMDWSLPAVPASLALLPDFRLCLRLQLGRIHIAVRRLQRLQPGDILLLAHMSPQAWRGNRALFDIDLHPETMTVTTIPATDDTRTTDHVPQGGGTSDLIDLAGLTLSLDVSLGQLELTLAELSALQAGTVLPLPDSAYQRIQLLHEGRTVATGELVQIGERLGVQLAQVPRSS